MGRRKRPVEVKVTEAGCHEVISHAPDGRGYVPIRVDGKSVGAHRVAYVMAHGPIPEGLMIMHKCSNKKCINPEHLEAGTCGENIQDYYEEKARRIVEEYQNSK